MALYHKWDVKNGSPFVLHFFSLIFDGLGGVKLFIDANVYAHATAAGNKKISDKKASV